MYLYYMEDYGYIFLDYENMTIGDTFTLFNVQTQSYFQYLSIFLKSSTTLINIISSKSVYKRVFNTMEYTQYIFTINI